MFSSLKFNTFLNAVRSSDRKYKGQPKNATLPSIALPQDKTLTV